MKTKHRLENATHLSTPNIGAKMTARAVVLHYTAGASPGPAINTFMNEKSRVSAHVVIDRAGLVTQLADFDRVTWHAGVSSLLDLGPGCNRYSIGIELVNRGWSHDAPHLREAHEWSQVGTRYWHEYTEVQLVALDKILETLWATYSPQVLTGHEHVAPGRKSDPGPLFPWARYAAYPIYIDNI